MACKNVSYWELGQRVAFIGMWCHCEFDNQAAFKCGVSGRWVSVLPVKNVVSLGNGSPSCL